MLNEIYFKEFLELETERLIIRKLDLSYAQAMQALRSQDKVVAYLDSDPHSTVEHSKNFIKKNLEMYASKKGIFWALIDKSTERFIGDFAFWNIDTKNHRSEIGYTLSPEYWGKGIMKEAMFTLFNFGFKDLNLHSFEANINPENKNSRGILLRVGFKKEAYFEENYFYNGDFLDSEIYSLLQRNFINATTK